MRIPDGRGGDSTPGVRTSLGLYEPAVFWIFGGGEGAYITTGHDDYSRTPWFPTPDADLGCPLGRSWRTLSVWMREFKGGVTVITLGEEGSGTVRLPAGLRSPGPIGNLDGEALALEVRPNAYRGITALRV